MAREITPSIPPQDLPFWMRQATQGIDWGFLLAVVFALAAAWPFMLQPGLPRTNASENHVFMAQDYNDTLREGRWYPRWSPHVFGGYGAPIPNYYPPGAAYLAALVEVLFTNDAVSAVRFVYVLAFGVAGAALYTLVNRRSTASAAFLSVILYVYSPYVVSVAPHMRGDLPAVVALALLPLMLTLLDRLLSLNRPQDMLLTALATAALALTHLLTAAVGLVLALLLIVYHGRRAPWLTAAAALIGGIGMAAFFWVPAYAEQSWVVWYSRTGIDAPRLALNTLLQPVRPVDLAELIPAPQFKLGFVTIGFALIGALAALIVRRGVSFALHFLVTGAVLIATAVWVFPAEITLLGPVALCLSIGGSATVALLNRLPPRWRHSGLPALTALVLAGSLYAWLPPRWPGTFGGTQPVDQIVYEQQGFGIAVLPPDSPVPTTISPSLPPNRFLINGYQSGNINKVAPAQGVSNRLVNVLSHTTHGDRFRVELQVPSRLDILTAYFPGWQATTNVRNITLRLIRNEQTGLIAIDAPAMNGELSVTLIPTEAQRTGWLVSWIALAVGLVLTARRIRRGVGRRDLPGILSQAEARLLAVVLICFASVIVMAAAPFAPLSLYPRPGHALDNAVAIRSRTETGLEALAYRTERTRYRAGETLNFTLYWQALRTLPDNYRVQVYLLEPGSGVRWHRTDYRTPGSYPTRRWRTYAYVTDPYQIALSETMIPGDYQVAVEVFSCNPVCDSDQRQTFFNAGGSGVGQTLVLPTVITVTR